MLALILAVVFTCGVERHDVKVLKDHPTIGATTKVSIALLRKLVPPASPPTRRVNQEYQLVEVEAFIVGYKLETDQDFHIVIKDANGLTMIVESVAQNCATSTKTQVMFQKVRSQFRGIFFREPVAKFYKLEKPIKVTVSGFLFFDKVHGQIGVAPNGIEIHPILSVLRSR